MGERFLCKNWQNFGAHSDNLKGFGHVCNENYCLFFNNGVISKVYINIAIFPNHRQKSCSCVQ